MRIDRIEARQISDTRGKPTIETTISAGEIYAIASVPSGKSTGSHEAKELRDSDGSVATAVGNINGEIAQAFAGNEFNSADEIDRLLVELDGTQDKSRLGANAILSVSVAAARFFAEVANTPLWRAVSERANTKFSSPRLYINCMEGGVHANFSLPFQEYLLVIEGGASTSLPLARELFIKLGERLPGVQMGDEGGYAPSFDTIEKPFEILSELIADQPSVSIAIDAAASELFSGGVYNLLDKKYSSDELAIIYNSIVEQFNIKSIEDPFDENDSLRFTRITTELGGKVLIIGDDLTVTDPVRIKELAAEQAMNAVLIKPNQIGTVREALEAVRETYNAGFKAVASHRSGETSDTFIADFAYGIGAYGIKAGGLGQAERLAKYERLIEIEREA